LKDLRSNSNHLFLYNVHANTHITWSIGDLQIGQPFAMFDTVSAHVTQKRE